MAAQRATAYISIFNRLTTCGRAGIPREAFAVNFGGSISDNRWLHSESQARNDNEDTHAYEKDKMAAEGGGVAGRTISEESEEVKEQVEGKAKEVEGAAKSQVSKNVDTAKDMFSDFPQKVSETATGLKEVGVEAGKAVKRDASKLAQKTGLKTD